VFGGWLPMWFIGKGWQVFRARKTAMLIFAICILPVVFTQYLGSMNMWLAVIMVGLAMGFHQAWSSNIFTTVSDMFPKATTASVTGIGGMFGAVGGILIARGAGKLFDYYKLVGDKATGYFIMFIICGLAYLLAWLIMHFLVPRLKKIEY
jgi:ACS family hexuronate transporter-like MFS transporter